MSSGDFGFRLANLPFLDLFCLEVGNSAILLFTCQRGTELRFKHQRVVTLESPYHLAAVSGAHFTQMTILIVILVSSGSAKSRTQQSAVGGFLVTRRGWPGRLRACRIWTFINSV